MKRRTLSLLLSLVLLLGLFPMAALAADPADSRFLGAFEQRSQAPAGYIVIDDPADLKAMSGNLSGNYILMDDITLSPGWTPIGTEDAPFTGILDGNGFTISGLSQTWTSDEDSQLSLGLFGMVKGAAIRNLKVSGSLAVDTDEKYRDQYGWLYMGGIAGQAENSVFTNCITDVAISDDDLSHCYYHAMGGVVGQAESSTIQYCYNLNEMYSLGEACGGIVGVAVSCTIYACRNDSSLHGGLNSGGIAGDCASTSVASCANTAHLFVGDIGGGIVGRAYQGTSVSDCLNTGKIQLWEAGGGVPVSSGIVGGRSYKKGEVTISRCVNVGEVARFAAIVCGTAPVVTDCYWLDTSASYMRFHTSDGSDTETGKLTADQMKKQESYEGLSFLQKWTLEEGMDYPFPTPLLFPPFENTYMTTYTEDTDASLRGGRYATIMAGSGTGSLAGMLGRAYEDANLRGIDLWGGVKYLNRCLSFDGYTIQNDFDVIVADVFSNAVNSQEFQSVLADNYLDNFSNAVTELSFLYDAATAKVIQDKLAALAKLDDVFTTQAAGEIKEIQNLVKKSVKADGVGYSFVAVGSVVNLLGSAMTTAEAAMEEIDRYVLCNAYVDAVEEYGQVLYDTAEKSYSITHGTLRPNYLRTAIYSFVNKMNDYAQENYTTLYLECGKDLLGMASPAMSALVDGIYWNMADLCPVFAGIKTGLSMGQLVGNAATNMDGIDTYGKLLDMAGYMAQVMFQVVRDRQAELSKTGEYEDAAALQAATDLYLSLQILACDYAIGYSNALASAALVQAVPAFNLNTKHVANTLLLQAQKADLQTLQEKGQNITVGPDGSIHGFIAQCPVTVIVETKGGTEIARLSTGEKSVNSAYDDVFHLMGESMEIKTGFYDPEKHNLRIEGDGTGTMDLTLFSGTKNNLMTNQVFLDLPVSSGDLFLPAQEGVTRNGTLILPDDTYTLPPLEAAYQEGILTLTNLPADLAVMIAAYDGSGKMTGIQVVEDPSAAIPVTVTGEKMTAFFLDGNSAPIRAPLPIQ